jgi:hypothetical protein
MYKLLIHQWKEKIRSPFWQKSIILNIVLGILGLYLMLNILAIGFFADKIILSIYKDGDVVKVFTGLLFYYFAFDLIFRFLLQQLPTLSIQPYLTLPVKKSTLLHYPLLKTVPDLFNVIALLLILPFFIKVICITQSPFFCLTWIVSVFSFIVTNNYLNFSLKKYFSKRPLLILLLLAFVGSFLYLDIANVVSFSGFYSSALLYLANNPFLVVLPVAIAIFAYMLAYFLLKRNSYIEDSQSQQRSSSGSFLFLNRFGETGNLIQVEVKMILRNKRPKSLLYLSLIFLAYGLMFYRKRDLDNYLILTFVGLFLTSMFAINYGQYMFSWESSFFDSYMANKIERFKYLKSKYLFFSISCFIMFFLTLPYAFISYKIGLINASLLLYNIGISSIIMMFFSTYNTSRIDLGKSQFMNYQGTGITQFLVIFPVMGIPALAYLAFNHFGIPEYTFYVLGIIGVTGIVFNKYLIQMVANQFVKRKYKMAVGFRQK